MAGTSPDILCLDDLVGAWRLEAFVFTDDADAEVHPLGPDPVGSVAITPDGYLSLVFMARNRPHISSPDVLAGAEAERAAAAATYVSFGGPVRLEDDVAVVDVDHAFFPNWVGSEQRRRVTLEGDRLTLATLQAIPIQGRNRRGRARLVRHPRP